MDQFPEDFRKLKEDEITAIQLGDDLKISRAYVYERYKYSISNSFRIFTFYCNMDGWCEEELIIIIKEILSRFKLIKSRKLNWLGFTKEEKIIQSVDDIDISHTYYIVDLY